MAGRHVGRWTASNITGGATQEKYEADLGRRQRV
jgi:hypothetical protein